MYTNTGKQVLKDGRHFADADSVENAELIAEGLNAYTGYSDQEPLLEPVERGEPVEAPPALQGTPRPCAEYAQGDELACHCGLRWERGEDRPPCPNRRTEWPIFPA